MPYFLTSDTFADDPLWEVLAGGNADLIDRLQSAHQRLMSKASHTLSDGYLTEGMVMTQCRGRRKIVDLLRTPALGRAPVLHKRGDVCACLGAEDDWTDGYEYRLHKFLKRNPSKAEVLRNRAQKADLRDARLKSMVYARDGGCCRYCRSGPLSPKAVRSRDRRKVLQFDHVDPDKPAEADGTGLVVACASCNEHKGHRTPDEADMALLPEPADAERAAWTARGLALFDRPDQNAITDEPATDHPSAPETITETIINADGDHQPGPIGNTTAELCPDNDDHTAEHRERWSAKDPGRVGEPHSPDPPVGRPAQPSQPTRSPDSPDIYHRRSRPPAPAPESPSG